MGLLICSAADVAAVDKSGYTALQLAIEAEDSFSAGELEKAAFAAAVSPTSLAPPRGGLTGRALDWAAGAGAGAGAEEVGLAGGGNGATGY